MTNKLRRVRNEGTEIRRVTDIARAEPAMKIENVRAVPVRQRPLGPQSTPKICALIRQLKVGQSFVCTRAISGRHAVMFANLLLADGKYIATKIEEDVYSRGAAGRLRIGRIK